MNAQREKILQAAYGCFLKYGISKTSMSDIAREAGVSKSTIYYYFSGKDDLIIAILRKECNDLLARLKRIAAEKLPTEEKLQRMIGAKLEYIHSLVSRARLSVEEYMKELNRIKQRLSELYERHERRILKKVVKEGIEKGEIKGGEQEVLDRMDKLVKAAELAVVPHQPRLAALASRFMRLPSSRQKNYRVSSAAERSKFATLSHE